MEDLQKIIQPDPNRVVTPEQRAKTEKFGAFMQKLQDEGKLLEYFRMRDKKAKELPDNDWDALLK